MTSVTVSAKIPEGLKRKLEKYGLEVSRIVREALEAKVQEAEEQELSAILEKVSQDLKGKLTVDDIVSAVREAREADPAH